MSHFIGLWQRDGLAWRELEHAAFERVLAALKGRSDHCVDTLAEGSFWCAAVSVSPNGVSCLQRASQGLPPGLAGAVAGDPLPVGADGRDIADGAAWLVRHLAWQGAAAAAACCGMFAAMAFDTGAARLTLATDHLANRALYHAIAPGRVAFSTSLDLLRLLQGGDERVDEQGLAELILMQQPLGRRTVLRDIAVLGPGELLCIDASSHRHETAIDHTATPRQVLDHEAALAAVHARFGEAVRRRLQPAREVEEAFLSGGMDSRCVVAELIDRGHRVRTFSAAFADSVDDVSSRAVAAAFGTEHTVWHKQAADRVRVALDPFTTYARRHFPAREGANRPRAIWSGDGGSVALGHVYLTPANVALAAQPASAEVALKLFPQLGRPAVSRHFGAARSRRLREAALAGVVEELRRCEQAPPDRRLFHFYMRNDQMRHLAHQHEAVDRTGIELLTPFFDRDFVAQVAALPIEGFLLHRFYNDWIRGFRCGAGDHHWQPYPGHLPSPHEPPQGVRGQWDRTWYEGPDVRRSYQAIARDLLRWPAPLARGWIRAPVLRAAAVASRLGSARWHHEIELARNLDRSLAHPA